MSIINYYMMRSSSEEGTTTPKLSMLSSRATRAPEISTPPLHAAVSVPFEWEEVPGKPRNCPDEQWKAKSTARTLELPPRLAVLSSSKVSNVESPTTVLEGPYMARTMSLTSSNRMNSSGRDYWNGGFGSCRWTGFLRNNREKEEEGVEGSFDFSRSAGNGRGSAGVRRCSRAAVGKRGSFFGNTSHTRSHLWVSLKFSFLFFPSFSDIRAS